MDLDHFAVILADRLSAIVPAGIQVAATDGVLWYSAQDGRFPGQQGDYRAGRAGTYIRANFGVYGESEEQNIIGIAVQALDELQDYVSEATHTPWPDTHTQPSPAGRIHDSRLDLWYGNDDNVVLACGSIPLADFS